jgi:hypothetical protein
LSNPANRARRQHRTQPFMNDVNVEFGQASDLGEGIDLKASDPIL